MKIKRIVVCGDSICSASTNPTFRGHFSDLLADQGYEVINIARGGITNTAICFQLAEAVKLNASLVIFNRTGSSRVDIPIKSFNSKLGLKNFIYPYNDDSSFGSPYTGEINANILSETTSGVFQRREIQSIISDDVKTAIRYYLAHLYDENLNRLTDDWMIGYWVTQLKQANISYIDLNQNDISQPIWDYIKTNPTKVSQCVYHTDKLAQQLVANNILQEIKKLEIS